MHWQGGSRAQGSCPQLWSEQHPKGGDHCANTQSSGSPGLLCIHPRAWPSVLLQTLPGHQSCPSHPCPTPVPYVPCINPITHHPHAPVTSRLHLPSSACLGGSSPWPHLANVTTIQGALCWDWLSRNLTREPSNLNGRPAASLPLGEVPGQESPVPSCDCSVGTSSPQCLFAEAAMREDRRSLCPECSKAWVPLPHTSVGTGGEAVPRVGPAVGTVLGPGKDWRQAAPMCAPSQPPGH